MAPRAKSVETATPVAPGASTKDLDPEEDSSVKPPYAYDESTDDDDDSDSEYTYEPGIINKKCCTICCVVLALIAAVVCALYFTVGKKEDQGLVVQGAAPTETPTISPTGAPTATPTSQLFSDILDLVLPFTPEETLLDAETPQGQAFRQLVAEVEESGGKPIPRRIYQRYALITLYLSTNPDGWATDFGWNDFSEDECEWYGIGTCRFLDDGSFAVSNLELENNGLAGELPSEICAMAENLESIDVSGNAIGGSIPSCFKDLHKVKELNLSDNQFNGEPPTGLFAIPTLTVLDFSQNQLQGEARTFFGADIAPTTLSAVRLNNNLLRGSFPAVVTAYSGLNELQFHGNEMTGAVPQNVCAMLLSTLTADCEEMACSCCTECF